MRLVAVGLLLITLTALVPVVPAAPLGPYDECADSATASNPCLRVSTAGKQPAPERTFYAWLAIYKCVPSLSVDCRGLPNGGALAGGIVYQESNDLDGLQREPVVVFGRLYPADKIVAA